MSRTRSRLERIEKELGRLPLSPEQRTELEERSEAMAVSTSRPLPCHLRVQLQLGPLAERLRVEGGLDPAVVEGGPGDLVGRARAIDR